MNLRKTHKRHPIAHRQERAMGSLSRFFGGKIVRNMEWSRVHCISISYTAYTYAERAFDKVHVCRITESHHGANSIAIGGIGGCCFDNPRCPGDDKAGPMTTLDFWCGEHFGKEVSREFHHADSMHKNINFCDISTVSTRGHVHHDIELNPKGRNQVWLNCETTKKTPHTSPLQVNYGESSLFF